MARDFMRAQDILSFKNLTWLGPEMGWDYKQLPGPFYYYFLCLLLVFKSIPVLFVLKSFFILCCVFLLVYEFNKKYPESVLSFCLLFLLTPLFVFSSRNFWNPSLITAINCLQIYLFLKIEDFPNTKKLALLFLIAFLAMQIHFSTLMIYFSISLTILSAKDFTRGIKKTQALFIGIMLFYLFLWYKLNEVPQFNKQLVTVYGVNQFYTQRFFDLLSFISLSFQPLQDYDLFTMLTRGLSELNLINYQNYLFLSILISAILFLLICFCLFKSKLQNKLDKLFIFHSIIFIFSLLLFKNKVHVPYRYGLCFLPLPFLFLSLNVSKIYKKSGFYYVVFTGFVFVFYAFFNFNIIKAQQILGRAHHTSNDNLEFTLRNKIEIYKKFSSLHSVDPFNNLHGRSINKFRLKEMNWGQDQSYFSIYQLVFGQEVQLSPKLEEQKPEESILVQLKNIGALKQDASESYTVTKLNPATDLPNDLIVNYYNQENKLILQKHWINTNLILPFAFIKPEIKIDHLQLIFKMQAQAGAYLNLLLDDNIQFHGSYAVIYSTPLLTIAGRAQQPFVKYTGHFLVQDQYVYKLDQESNKFEINLKVLNSYPNYSRIDLFVTPNLLAQEELF